MPIRYPATFLMVFVTISLSTAINAQTKTAYRFGKPIAEELTMRSYEHDSSASAVILYDKGYYSSQTGNFTRHTRIKILNKAGLSYANFYVRSPSKSAIDGHTFTMQDGVLTDTKLLKENIFQEEIIKGVEVYKIFFPNVKVGSVIDLKYSHGGIPFEWRFQDRIPVLYNELTIEPTHHVNFKKIQYGFEKIEAKGDYKWVAEKMPALMVEPFMSHYTNYLTKFKFDIQSYSFGFQFEISTSWEKISERLNELTTFGAVVRESPFLNEKAREIRESKEPSAKKIIMALQYIQDNLKWNDIPAVIASDGVRERFKKDHSGNSADLNLLLVSLLIKAGVNAYPMILSTRDNGLLNPASASLSSLNYVAAYVKEGDLEMVVDATLKYPVAGILPEQCRNLSGWVVDKSGGWWVDLSGGKAKTKKQFITIDLNSPEHFTADVMEHFEDYDFLEWIRDYEEQGTPDDYAKAVIAKSREFDIEEIEVVSVDKNKLKAGLRSRINLSSSDYVQSIGGDLEINPFVLNDITNPFKSEQRKFPIDFVYPYNRSMIIVIKIPQNYVLQNLPEPINMKAESGGARFFYQTSLTNSTLTIKCDLKVERQIFTEEEYPMLRNFFTTVGRKLSEPLQLKKKT